ncbi:DUF2642 domain-containing protein [Salirhabdus sp. Marseille-P4669]|uniref:DUF2642 domain-containing protein n=1 Tax=Salirhabdus sp. Marseille-P4669 TaxID=2042310 RepID=UPI001F25FB31|nr:DUF2642 domain-containing protein [Salirhabdus sp. Marseille-P4669]
MLNNYVNEKINVELSGKINYDGILIEIGADIIVLFDGDDYLYIPILHIQKLKKGWSENFIREINDPGESPFYIEKNNSTSLRKILNVAKGTFVEIFVTGHQSIHGYITNILSDYFVFYSPVYKTMFIPIKHLKWLIPYIEFKTPYSLNKQDFPVNPSEIGLSRTFEIQLEKLKEKIVVFDLGLDKNKIGQLTTIKHNMVEMITAREESIFLNLHHIKTVHFP